MLRCVICTALGDPVDPEVSCISARSSSPTSIGSIGSEASRSADREHLDALLLEHRYRDHERLGNDDGLGLDHAARRSSCPRPRPRGRCAGWAGEAWSGWRHASTGPARSGRSPPGSRPARRRRRRGRCRPSARPPAMQRARSCTSPQVWRTGSYGSPVTMPVVTVWALRYIFSVNRLTTTSSVSGAGAPATSASPQMSFCHAPPDQKRVRVGAHTNRERLSLEMVMHRSLRRIQLDAHRGVRWVKESRPIHDRQSSPLLILSNS